MRLVPPFAILAFLASIGLSAAIAPAARAQELSAAERQGALSSVRTFADCLERHHAQMDRLLQLIAQSERQRDTARDARVREDAERAIDALIGRAATVQGEARTCLSSATLPTAGPGVIVRPPPPDEAADHIAQRGGTVRLVEEDTRLGSNLRVLRGEQVDGEGVIARESVQRAFHAIGGGLERCYEQYLERGSLAAHPVTLVFTVGGSGTVQRVVIERSTIDDRTFDRCVTSAARRLRTSDPPRGGDATFSYSLRFGR